MDNALPHQPAQMPHQTLRNVGIFIGCLVLCQAAGGIGTIATIPNIPTWYAGLNKPDFQPPNWLFGPVWTALYTLMAVVLYILIKSTHPDRTKAIIVFAIQLILNAAWSFLFFEFHLLLVSMIEILVVLATLVIFCFVVGPISRASVYCFIPYIAWVGFASLLNIAIWYMN